MTNRSSQTRALIFAGLALLALIALAATLSALEFDPGSPMPFWQMGPALSPPDLPETWQEVALTVLRVLMIAFWLLLPVFVVLLIVNKRFRRQFVRDMLFFMPILVALYLFYRARTEREMTGEELGPPADFGLGELVTGLEEDAAAAPVYTPPDPAVTNIVTTLIAVAIALLLLAVVYRLYRRSRMQQLEPLKRIQDEAQAALDDLQAGGDLRDVILRAYAQMMDALREFRNIHRDRHMTPHEFESYLAQRGLPRQPVHQLTEIFEQVRYGGAVPGRAEERAAVASLSAIVSAIQRERLDDR